MIPDADPLRHDLREFTEVRMRGRLTLPVFESLAADDPVPARRELVGATDQLGLLIKVFVLGERLTPGELATALPGTVDRDTLAPGGRAAISIRPVRLEGEDLLIASDFGSAITGQPLPPEFVMGVGGVTRTLAALMPDERGQTLLDLGTGSGVLAVLAAKRGYRVTATDISERAIALAALTADLNDVEVELIQGDLFEPVRGRRFDAVISNPPFVITPESAAGTSTYREAGRAGDDLCAAICHALPDHLTEPGHAVMLANWEHRGDQPWEERVTDWMGTLSGLAIQRTVTTPALYARTWLTDEGIPPQAPGHAERVWEWLDDFDSRDVTAIGFGYLILHAAENPHHLTLDTPGAMVEGAREWVGVVVNDMSVLDLSSSDLAERAIAPVNALEKRYHAPGGEDPWLIMLASTAGPSIDIRLTTEAAAIIGASDGELTIAQLAAAVASLMDTTAEAVWSAAEGPIRECIRHGLVEFR